MDDRVRSIQCPDKCKIFEKNARDRGYDGLAQQAIERSLVLRAELHGADTEAELKALEAVFAYEEVLSRKNRKKTRAVGTWQLIRKHGILPAVERTVINKPEAEAYQALKDIGLENYAFEIVITSNPELFSKDVVKTSEERMKEWQH
ncbi:MAG: hypothetical protein V7744_11615 [Pseudomonadales bacterium]